MHKQFLAMSLGLYVVLSVAICGPVSGQGVVVATASWGNHEYKVVTYPAQTWDNAKDDVNFTLGENFHLATITSQAEQDFVQSLMLTVTGGTYWLGGFQPPGETNPSANWSWVTGEPWEYTSWSPLHARRGYPTQPDDAYGDASEQHLAIWHHDLNWNDEGHVPYIYGYVAEERILSVLIDIKPGSFPNSINLGSNGVVPVAILSSEDFDARTVDESTVELAGAFVAIRGKNHYLASVEDVNDDGLPDLVCHVDTENLDPGTFQDGFAFLTGETFDGEAIEGFDEIRIVPPE